MKIRMTFNLDDDDRRAIAAEFGKSGKASRRDCENFIYAVVVTSIEVIEAEDVDAEPSND